MGTPAAGLRIEEGMIRSGSPAAGPSFAVLPTVSCCPRFPAAGGAAAGGAAAGAWARCGSFVVVRRATGFIR